jgi:hypothetical protein
MDASPGELLKHAKRPALGNAFHAPPLTDGALHVQVAVDVALHVQVAVDVVPHERSVAGAALHVQPVADVAPRGAGVPYKPIVVTAAPHIFPEVEVYAGHQELFAHADLHQDLGIGTVIHKVSAIDGPQEANVVDTALLEASVLDVEPAQETQRATAAYLEQMEHYPQEYRPLSVG